MYRQIQIRAFNFKQVVFIDGCFVWRGTMLSQDVCLSVCLSVIRRYCVETAKHYHQAFSTSGSHTVLVFSTPNFTAIFRRVPPPVTGPSNARVYENKRSK